MQVRESTCQIKPTTNPYMQGDQNSHGKYQNHYAKRNKIGNQYNQHVNISNEYGNEAQRKYLSQNPLSIRINNRNQHVKYLKQNISMKHKENHCVKIPNQDNRLIRSIMSMSQVKTREPSMCNQEVSTH